MNWGSRRMSPGLSAKRDLSTTVMGQAISLPVIISPDRGAGGAPGR